MKEAAPKRIKPTLNQEAFDCLLLALDPDRQMASEEYERLRRRLVRFFEWQGTTTADDLADETLDRLALKLFRGEQILDLRNYLHGIARMVLRESRQRRRREETLIERTTHFLRLVGNDPAQEELFDAMQLCFDRLPKPNQQLLLRYYSSEGRQQGVTNRQQMAIELGISLNALRNRALRLRAELEQATLLALNPPKGKRDKSTTKYT